MYQQLKTMQICSIDIIMKLNDLVGFIRFAQNGSPHIKTSGQTYILCFFNKCTNLCFCGLEHIVDRSKESFHAKEMFS